MLVIAGANFLIEPLCPSIIFAVTANYNLLYLSLVCRLVAHAFVFVVRIIPPPGELFIFTTVMASAIILVKMTLIHIIFAVEALLAITGFSSVISIKLQDR